MFVPTLSGGEVVVEYRGERMNDANGRNPEGMPLLGNLPARLSLGSLHPESGQIRVEPHSFNTAYYFSVVRGRLKATQWHNGGEYPLSIDCKTREKPSSAAFR
jgi:hypothetical protein